ncbi:MAG TPA: hypothetical protein DF613_17415 [Lachnospiraceae bacterium]|nr:hypothetical protein [Lachnospiraceae bacterium]
MKKRGKRILTAGVILFCLFVGGNSMHASPGIQPVTLFRVLGTTPTEPALPPSLTQDMLTLKIGLTETLEVCNLPSGVKVTGWSSSDSLLASVNKKGKITAKRPGEAIITASLSDGRTLSCVVSIPEIQLNSTTLTLVKDKTKKLKVSGTSAQGTWTSSAPDVASVAEDGTVTALKYGNATIKVKTGQVTLSCKVKVVDPVLNLKELVLIEGDSYTLKGSQYTGSVSWSTSEESVATVTGKGVVKAVKSGSAEIYMQANGVKIACPVKVVSVNLNKIQVTMSVGSKVQLKATGSSIKGEWSSSDSARLKVSSGGKCTAKKTGDAEAIYTVGQSSISCYVIIEKKGAEKTFGGTVLQGPVGISSLRNQVLGRTSVYRFLQGSCTDGTYGYFILGHRYYQPYCALIKVRLSDWKPVKVKKGLKLYHGNDVTYNAKTKTLVVVHGDGDTQKVSYVSPGTLKIKKQVNVGEAIHAVAYNRKRNRYVVGLSKSYAIQIRDANWKTLKTIPILEKKNYTRQGIDCDDSYIYILQSYLSARKNRIMVYDWKGNFVTQVFTIGSLEGESLFHVGKQFTVAYNDSAYSGGTVYQTTMRRYYQLWYTSGGGKGRMAAKLVKNGSGAKLAGCKFTKANCKFLGWKATRQSDGAVYCYNPGTKKKGWYRSGKQPEGYTVYFIPGGTKMSSMSSKPGDRITLEAQWKENSAGS